MKLSTEKLYLYTCALLFVLLCLAAATPAAAARQRRTKSRAQV